MRTAYDSSSAQSMSDEDIQSAISTGKILNVTYVRDSQKSVTLAGRLEKIETGYRFTPRRKGALGAYKRSMDLTRAEIRKIEVIEKEGLCASEAGTFFLIVGLVLIVAASTVVVASPVGPIF
ncbi:MAG TPA: hypothetical protein PL129_06580 [bacterium]|nr:hypothetical protein [bacterium]